jgi:outer membrane protein OmpA-like peptidoglycan-associated protein
MAIFWKKWSQISNGAAFKHPEKCFQSLKLWKKALLIQSLLPRFEDARITQPLTPYLEETVMANFVQRKDRGEEQDSLSSKQQQFNQSRGLTGQIRERNQRNSTPEGRFQGHKERLGPLSIHNRQQKGAVQAKMEPKVKEGQTETAESSQSLPETFQAKMEHSFGTDFSTVNVHKDSASATELGALAYTQGEDIHFAPGQFNPDSPKGQSLIGHELAHVVQQRQGRVKPTTQMKGKEVNDDSALEREADEIGRMVAAGQSTHEKLRNGDGIASNNAVQMAKHEVEMGGVEGPEEDNSYFSVDTWLNVDIGLPKLTPFYLPDDQTILFPTTYLLDSGKKNGKGTLFSSWEVFYDTFWPWNEVTKNGDFSYDFEWNENNNKVSIKLPSEKAQYYHIAKDISLISDISKSTKDTFIEETFIFRAPEHVAKGNVDHSNSKSSFNFSIGDEFEIQNGIKTNIHLEVNGEDLVLILAPELGAAKKGMDGVKRIPYTKDLKGKSATLDGIVEFLKKQNVTVDFPFEVSNKIRTEIGYSYTSDSYSYEFEGSSQDYTMYGKLPATERNKAVIVQEEKVSSREVLFEKTKQSQISGDWKKNIDQIVTSEAYFNEIKDIADRPLGKRKIGIEGYTDSQGSKEDNIKLSGDRASSLMEYLITCKALHDKGVFLSRTCFTDPKLFGEKLAVQDRVFAPDRKAIFYIGTLK